MPGKNPAVIHLIAAARPNFMKIAPLYHALAKESWCTPLIVHTGQHYDANMSDAFFRDLRLPTPHVHLGVGSGTHAEQTGGVMIAYEKACQAEKPDWVVVVGDVNSTAACAMVGAKMWIPVVHLEAGLRSGDRTMPEEINRLVTDAICDLLWTPSIDADVNLRHEGVAENRIERVGNIMIDSFEMLRSSIESDDSRSRLVPRDGPYGIVTLHRPSNVDGRENLALLVSQIVLAADAMPLVFAVHPRTHKKLVEHDLLGKLQAHPNVVLTGPLGYIQFMGLVCHASMVITDSGGVQEETTYLGIPCLTLRDTTERPITISEGSNRLVPPAKLLECIGEVQRGHWPTGRRPDLWDGQAAARCVNSLRRRGRT
jgi:UDP-N-acetylglucosamine 2-epimerase (non-hydrolysing)